MTVKTLTDLQTFKSTRITYTIINKTNEYVAKRTLYSPGIADVASKRLLTRVDPLVPLLVLLPLEFLTTVDTVILANMEVVILNMATQQVGIG